MAELRGCKGNKRSRETRRERETVGRKGKEALVCCFCSFIEDGDHVDQTINRVLSKEQVKATTNGLEGHKKGSLKLDANVLTKHMWK
ncbi:unnamed protein product [Lactuca virosa]|uniref:Uncharacterized protein n=1 Tax=Lactuca virosa TaxID=75947 RepID=A0AAU9LCY2_9ASTR|nr:unnamed protein product [Lactuca virosa]